MRGTEGHYDEGLEARGAWHPASIRGLDVHKKAAFFPEKEGQVDALEPNCHERVGCSVDIQADAADVFPVAILGASADLEYTREAIAHQRVWLDTIEIGLVVTGHQVGRIGRQQVFGEVARILGLDIGRHELLEKPKFKGPG